MALSRLTARRTALAIAIAALPAAGLAVSPASALTTRACDTGGSQHVYSLTSFRGAPCGSALVISHRLANRYSDPTYFHARNSTGTIAQKDAVGRSYSCKWQSGSAHGDIALWACRHGRTVVTWIWRFQAL